MKKMLIIMLLLCSMPVLAEVKSSDILISLLKYEPVPAEPGQNVKIWLNIQNIGERAENVQVRIKPEYPFLGVGELKYNVPPIPAIEDHVLEAFMLVDINAPNGVHDLVLEYKTDTYSDAWTEIELPISVSTGSVALTLERYSILPKDWIPGQPGIVSMQFENNGRVGVRNVDIQIDIQDTPFSPVGSGNKKRIQSISGGQMASVDFDLIPDTSAGVGIFKVPVTLTYFDTKGKRYNESTTLAIMLNSPPKTEVVVASVDSDGADTPSTVGIKFINKGVANLKYVNLELVKDPAYEILTPSNTDYLGNVDNDDFETSEFLIKPKNRQTTLKVRAEYLDEYNKEHSEMYDLPVTFYSAQEIEGGGSKAWVVIVLIVAGVGYYYYKKKKK
ncbi:MAG: hypothetical protein QF486_01215 [Candidatus Woesearchaeota archaeon]|jgi:hypothetical protein|nr:hypothetical protein [Candidatus Woesearchaeota archaeon]MDP7198214.1 hypothetical protein [Candidatus Woesearchaeota archaeon]MDP7467050.1 hypothetical protein [Candidatus Woesearchaeota archaeon]MDP7646718.1 hypothetical protein [Candidatus Woesearchaeota archaeon]